MRFTFWVLTFERKEIFWICKKQKCAEFFVEFENITQLYFKASLAKLKNKI